MQKVKLNPPGRFARYTLNVERGGCFRYKAQLLSSIARDMGYAGSVDRCFRLKVRRQKCKR